MINEKSIMAVFLVFVSIIQALQFSDVIMESYPNWPAPFTLLISLSPSPPLSYLISWYVGFGIISFFIRGNVKEQLEGYGKYIFVRNYSKTKFILKRFLLSIVQVIFLVNLQFVFSLLVFWVLDPDILVGDTYSASFIKSLVLYFITTISLILIQLILEFYFSSTTAYLIINGYVAVSIASWTYLSSFNQFFLLKYLGIANYMLALRTNASIQEGFYINQDIALLIVVLIIFVTTIFATFKVRKIDIY